MPTAFDYDADTIDRGTCLLCGCAAEKVAVHKASPRYALRSGALDSPVIVAYGCCLDCFDRGDRLGVAEAKLLRREIVEGIPA